MKVNNGDVKYKVNIVPLPILIVGGLTTKDRYARIYEITVDLVVSDPTLFIHGYRLGRDPVNLAIRKVKSSLQDYASRVEHDNLVSFNRPKDAWNDALCRDTGMKVTQMSQWNLRDDPKREELSAIQQEAQKNMFSMMINAEIQKLEDSFERERDSVKRLYERLEQEKQKGFEREEETRQNMHQLYNRLRSTAAQELTDILRERIRDTFERGKPIDEVAEESLKLLNAFHESLNRGSVVDSTLSNEHIASKNGSVLGEDTTFESDLKTDPSMFTPPNLKDLSGATQNEAGQ
jgi:hypothetical protein